MINQQKLYHTENENLKQFFTSIPNDSIVAIEACGFDHWLGDFVEDMGFTVKLAQ